MDNPRRFLFRSGLKDRLNVVATIAVLVTCLIVMLRSGAGSETPRPPVSISESASVGEPSAAAVIIEFADFECPACTSFAKTVFPLVRSRYIVPGRVQFVFRHFPLDQHQQARRMATLAECARAQGRFWPFHDGLFDVSPRFDPATVTQVAAGVGLDVPALFRCAEQESPRIGNDLTAVEALGLNGTPSFLFGKRNRDGTVQPKQVLGGLGRPEDFLGAIESLLR